MDMEKLTNDYYTDNARKLRSVVDRILFKFGNITDKDSFYSLANEVFVHDILRGYDGESDFDGFVYTCLSNKIKSEVTKMNRDKRMSYARDKNGNKILDANGDPIRLSCLSIDFAIDHEDDGTFEDFLQLDDELHEEDTSTVEKYLDSLTKRQAEIAKMLVEGYSPAEIQELLHISEKEYRASYSSLKDYSKKRLLQNHSADRNSKFNQEEEEAQLGTEEAFESHEFCQKSKNTSYSIEQVSKKIRAGWWRDDLAIQRAYVWDNIMKSELISCILQEKVIPQIVLSEEPIGKEEINTWILDGKQRCSTVDDYLYNGFAISRLVQRFEISYQEQIKDEDGNYVYSDNGRPMCINKTFDIRGKKFWQLPEELQDRFKSYQIPVLMNLNSTKEEIAYDIARFNRGKTMTKAQNGWTGIDDRYAVMIDKVLDMDFFKTDSDKSAYTKADIKNGNLRRMIVEAFIAANHADAFKEDVYTMCRFISDTVSKDELATFLDYIKELVNALPENTAELFKNKNSFLFFALFAKFKDLGLDTELFVNFLLEFIDNLYYTEIDGVSFESLDNNKACTKSRNIVRKKLNLLESLMYIYLKNQGAYEDYDIDDAETDVEECSDEEYVAEMVDLELDEVIHDFEFYQQSLDDLLEGIKDEDSELLKPVYRLPLLAMTAYSYKNDKDLDSWIRAFATKKHNLPADKKQSYYGMVKNYETYEQRGAA